jgi:hypothetical protein
VNDTRSRAGQNADAGGDKGGWGISRLLQWTTSEEIRLRGTRSRTGIVVEVKCTFFNENVSPENCVHACLKAECSNNSLLVVRVGDPANRSSFNSRHSRKRPAHESHTSRFARSTTRTCTGGDANFGKFQLTKLILERGSTDVDQTSARGPLGLTAVYIPVAIQAFRRIVWVRDKAKSSETRSCPNIPT